MWLRYAYTQSQINPTLSLWCSPSKYRHRTLLLVLFNLGLGIRCLRGKSGLHGNIMPGNARRDLRSRGF